MKKIITMILAALVLGCVTYSCRVRSINGDLDAQWQVMHVLYADGSEAAPSNPGLYISFYRHTMQFTAYGVYRVSGNLVYNEEASTITIEMPSGWDAEWVRWGMDAPADPNVKPYTATLKIESLNSKNMTLVTAEGNVISLRKY